jgi:hypothetical protein
MLTGRHISQNQDGGLRYTSHTCLTQNESFESRGDTNQKLISAAKIPHIQPIQQQPNYD